MNEWAPLDSVPPETAALPAAESQPEEKYPFWDYADAGMLLVLIIPCLIVAFLIVRTVTVAAGWRPPLEVMALLPAQFLFYGLWFLSLYGLLKLRYGRPFWKSLAWTRSAVTAPRAATIGLLAAVGTLGLGLLLHAPPVDSMPIKELLRDRVSVILVSVFAVTLGPLCEELAFRGFLLPLLVRSLGVLPGLVATAIPFSVLHGPQYSWAWQHLLIISLVGVAFGWMRLWSGSTLATAVMHASYNLFFTVLLLLGKTS